MKKTFITHILTILVVLLFSNSAFSQTLSGTYTIGVSSSTYSTFKQAIDSLVVNGVSGPVVLNVKKGNYNEQIKVPYIKGVSATNTITFKGLGDSTRIYHATSSSNRPVIHGDSSRHVIFDSLKIEATSSSHGWGINFNNKADSCVVKNCTVLCNGTGYGVSSLNLNNGTSSAGLKNANNIQVLNNLIDKTTNAVCFFGANSTTRTSGHLISNNVISNFNTDAIKMINVEKLVLNGNICSSSKTSAIHGFFLNSCGANCHIINNYIYLKSNINHTRLIRVAGPLGTSGGTKVGEEMLFINNMMVYDGSYTANTSGLYIKHTKHAQVYHNTVRMNKAGGTSSKSFWAENCPTKIDIKNNNFTSDNTAGYLMYFQGSSTSGSVSDYNNCYNLGSTKFRARWGATNYTTIASFRTASSQDANSVVLDPKFISTTDLHIKPTNLQFDNLGTNAVNSIVKKDYDKENRSSTKPDIGADEYASISRDGSLSSFLDKTYCLNLDTIKVKFENVGRDTITSIKLKWNDGGTPNNLSWTGILTTGNSTIITLTNNYNFTSGGAFIFTATIDSINGKTDLNGLNNSVKDTFIVPTIASLPIRINFNKYHGNNLDSIYNKWRETNGKSKPSTGRTSKWVAVNDLGGNGNINAKVNLFSNNQHEWMVGPVVLIDSTTIIKYKTAVTDRNSITTGDIMGSDDKVYVMLSDDCGVNWFSIDTLDKTDSISKTLTERSISLKAYKGKNIKVAFYATGGNLDDAEDYDFHIDDIFIGKQPDIDVSVLNVEVKQVGCPSNADSIFIEIANQALKTIDFSKDSTIVFAKVNTTLYSFTLTSGSLTAGSSMKLFIDSHDFTTAKNYNITAFVQANMEENFTNDTLRISTRTLKVNEAPLVVNFTGYTGSNIGSVFVDWKEAKGNGIPSLETGATWVASKDTGLTTNTTAKINLFGNSKNDWLISSPVSINSRIALKYNIRVNNAGSLSTSATMGKDDKLSIMVSDDCGFSWKIIDSITRTDNIGPKFTEQLVDLSAYNNKNVIFGFWASDGSLDDIENYDIHLDDINIDTIPILDVKPIGIISPKEFSCLYNAFKEPININIENAAMADLDLSKDSISVTIKITGANTQTIVKTLKSSKIPKYSSAAFTVGNGNFAKPGKYTLQIITSLPGDEVPSNDTNIFYITNSLNISKEFNEDFDSWKTTNSLGICCKKVEGQFGWINQSGDEIDWYVNTGNTFTASTGPTSDKVSGSGNYIYLEASGAKTKEGIISSPCILLDSMKNPHFSYYKSLYGRNMGKLYTEINNGNGWVILDSTVGDQGKGWIYDEFDLSNYTGLITLRFRGITGVLDKSDIAIDAVKVFDKKYDIALNGLIQPSSSCNKSSNEVIKCTIKNTHPTSTINKGKQIKVNFILNSGTTITETITLQSDFMPKDTIQFTFSTSADLSTSQIHQLKLFTTYEGDTNTLNDTIIENIEHYINAPNPIIKGDSACLGDSANVSITSLGNSFHWYSSNDPSNTTVLGFGPNYKINVLFKTDTLYAQDVSIKGCSSNRVPVIAFAKPIPIKPSLKDTTICEGAKTSLIVTGTGGIYDWFNTLTGGTSINTGTGYTTPILTNTTYYYVSEEVKGCVGPRERVIINVKPKAETPAIVNPDTLCFGDSIALIVTNGFNINWYKPGSQNSIGTGYIYTTGSIENPDTFIAINERSGCLSDPKTVVLNSFPKIEAPIVNNYTICEGDSKELTAASSNKVFWFVNSTDAIALDSGNSYTTPMLTNTKDYYVEAFVDQCHSTREKIQVIVSPLPNVLFNSSTEGPKIKSIAVENGSNFSHQWIFPDTTITGNSTVEVNVKSNGDYDIKHIVSNSNTGCKDSLTQTVSMKTVSLFELIKGSSFIYPNPNNGLFNISIPNILTPCNILIADASGRIVLKDKITNSNKEINSKLSIGVYNLQIVNGNRTNTIKLIVE